MPGVSTEPGLHSAWHLRSARVTWRFIEIIFIKLKNAHVYGLHKIKEDSVLVLI